MIPQVILNGISLGAMIALMAVGLSLIFGVLRIVNFYHGEAYMFGAVIAYYVIVTAGLSYILAGIIVVVAVGTLGWGLDILVFRRFHGDLIGGANAAIALSLGFQNLMWLIFGSIPRAIPSVLTGQLQLFGAIITKERLLIVCIGLSTILILAWFIKSTKMGKSLRAVQQDSEAALTMGINVKRIYAITFGLATALAGLAGFLMAPIGFIWPVMGMQPLFFSFTVIIIGGLGSIMGALIASFIIGLQQSFTTTFLSQPLATVISFGLALIILILRPRGLMGHEE